MCSRTEKYGIPRKTKTKYINEKIVITRRSCFVFFMFSVLGVRRRSFRIWKNNININCRNGVSNWFKVKVETTNLTTTLPGIGRESNTGVCKTVIEAFTLPIGEIILKLGGFSLWIKLFIDNIRKNRNHNKSFLIIIDVERSVCNVRVNRKHFYDATRYLY